MRPLSPWPLLALTIVACDGGGGGACVIDSDCSSFADVCISGTCQRAGADPEAGMADAGARRDAGGADAGAPPMDGGPGDAGPAMDAGPSEAGPMMCGDASGNWMVDSTPGSCGAAVVGTAIVIANTPPGSCTFDVTVPGGDPSLGLVGTFDLDMGNALMGTLDTGAQGPMICSGSLIGGAALNVLCGSCSMNLARM